VGIVEVGLTPSEMGLVGEGLDGEGWNDTLESLAGVGTL